MESIDMEKIKNMKRMKNMKVIYDWTSKGFLQDLEVGEIFIYKKEFFIKTRELNSLVGEKPVNVIHLQTGEPTYIKITEEVQVLEGYVSIVKW